MTGLQIGTLNSYQAVQLFITENMEKLSALPGFDALRQSFDRNLVELRSAWTIQNGAGAGMADTKRIKRKKMSDLTLEVSRKIVAMATIENDLLLLNEGKCTTRLLTLSRDTAVASIASIIHDLATDNLERLPAYGVDAQLLARLKLAIDEYSKSLTGPALGISSRHSATLRIAEIFRLNDALLRKMQILIGVLQSTDPDLVSMFRYTRKVINTGLRHLALKGMVRDEATGTGLAGVTVEFTAITGDENEAQAAHTKPDMVKKSGAKGGFFKRHFAEGAYRVVAYKNGFETLTYTAYVSHGLLCRVEIGLVKIQTD